MKLVRGSAVTRGRPGHRSVDPLTRSRGAAPRCRAPPFLPPRAPRRRCPARRRAAPARGMRRSSRRSRAGSSAISSTASRSRSGLSSASRMTVAAPASSIQRALVVWWSAEACGYGISTAGSPYWASSNTLPPAAGDGEVGGGERGAERAQVVAQDVVGPGRLELRVVALAGDVQDAVGRVGERLHGRGVDRAGAERAAEHEHAGLVRADAELGAGAGAVGDRRRHGAARSRGSARPRGPRAGRRGRRAGRGAPARGW